MSADEQELDWAGLSPEDLRTTLLNATQLLSQAILACAEADVLYAQVLDAQLTAEQSAARALIRAEASEAYAHKRHADANKARLLEMIRTVKAVLRSREFD